MTTPEEIIKLDNFKTESKLKRLRRNLERFRDDADLNLFTTLILDIENYQETLYPPKATNALIINSRKEFTFTNTLDYDKKRLFNRGIAKLYMEYAEDEDNNPFYITENVEFRFLIQDEVHYLVFVKPRRYNNYTHYKVE